MKSTSLFVATAAIALIAAVYVGNQRTRTNVAAGNHALAADFSLPDLDGKPLRLAGYKGKVILLDFWATWCTPCRTEIPQFIELQNQYGQQGFQVIGISLDDGPKPVREFYREFKINYPVAMGNEKIAEAYGGVFGLPVNFLIGRDGRIHAKHVGAADIKVLEQSIRTLLQEQVVQSTNRGRTHE